MAQPGFGELRLGISLWRRGLGLKRDTKKLQGHHILEELLNRRKAEGKALCFTIGIGVGADCYEGDVSLSLATPIARALSSDRFASWAFWINPSRH